MTLVPYASAVGSFTHRSVEEGDMCLKKIEGEGAKNPYLGFPFWVSPQGFKTRILGRSFHPLISNVSFPSPIDVGSHKASLDIKSSNS